MAKIEHKLSNFDNNCEMQFHRGNAYSTTEDEFKSIEQKLKMMNRNEVDSIEFKNN